GLDDGGCRECCPQLALVEERATVLPLTALGAVVGNMGAMREELPDRRFRHGGVQALDKLPGRIVELQFAPLAHLHDAGSGKALGMRGNAKSMAWRQAHALDGGGLAERAFEHESSYMGHCQCDTRLLGKAHLMIDPSRN